MGDGYWGGNTRLTPCTDNFTKEEVLILLEILARKYSIEATIYKRINPNNTVWRIRIKKSSMDKLILLVSKYMIPEMLYKLGIKN
jgi:hypothetical protein